MAFYPNGQFRNDTRWICVNCRATTSPANCVMNCDETSVISIFFVVVVVVVIFKLIHIPSELML